MKISDGFFQTSDIRSKNSIEDARFDKKIMANNISVKQFKYNGDKTDRLVPQVQMSTSLK